MTEPNFESKYVTCEHDRMRAFALVLLLSACRPTPAANDASASTNATSSTAPTLPTISMGPTPFTKPPTSSLGLSDKGQKALDVILNSTAFGGSAIGVAATPTPHVAALRELLAEPKAEVALEFAIDHATLPGKLTALSGLWLVNKTKFDVRIQPFKGSRDNVKLIDNGCAPGGDTIAVALLVERSHAVRLGASETLADWSAKNPGKPIELDIVGGGYPVTFKGR